MADGNSFVAVVNDTTTKLTRTTKNGKEKTYSRPTRPLLLETTMLNCWVRRSATSSMESSLAKVNPRSLDTNSKSPVVPTRQEPQCVVISTVVLVKPFSSPLRPVSKDTTLSPRPRRVRRSDSDTSQKVCESDVSSVETPSHKTHVKSISKLSMLETLASTSCSVRKKLQRSETREG